MNNNREEFEKWYVCEAFDYIANPIGSRECDLQWKAWKASRDKELEEVLEDMKKLGYKPKLLKHAVCVNGECVNKDILARGAEQARRLRGG